MKFYYSTDGTWPTMSELTPLLANPEVISTLNTKGIATVRVNDFEGNLYATWKNYDNTKCKITDDSDNVLMWGFVRDKQFTAKAMNLTIHGVYSEFERALASRNYIFATGLVETVGGGADATRLDLVDEEGNAFSWSASQWNGSGQNLGILITKEVGNVTDVVWDSSAGAENFPANTNTHAATHTKGDDTYWTGTCTALTSGATAYLTPTVDGTVIDDGYTITKLRVQMRVSLEYEGLTKYDYAYFYLEMYNGTSWVYQKTIVVTRNVEAQWYDIDHPIESDPVDYIEDSDASGEYDQLKGLRFGVHAYDMGTFEFLEQKIDYLAVTISYVGATFTPIQAQITGSGEDYITASGLDGGSWADLGVQADDQFQIGQNSLAILAETGSLVDVTLYTASTLSKYMARNFEGKFASDVIQSILDVEVLEMFEGIATPSLILIAEGDMTASGVSITADDYSHDWQYNDHCNQYKRVIVYGNPNYLPGPRIFEDTSSGNLSTRSKLIIDETINTESDRREIGNDNLQKYKVKRPSAVLPLKGVQSDLEIGTTINLTLEQPDGTDLIAATDYPMRKLVRKQNHAGFVITTVYAGLGSTPPEEAMANHINKLYTLLSRVQGSRLITGAGGTKPLYNYSEIIGLVAQLALKLDTTTFTTHAALATAHQNAPALIATHAAAVAAHHTKYTNAEALSASLWTWFSTKAYHYVGTTTTSGAYVVLDFEDGTSTETNVTQTSENWTDTIPSTATEVLIRVNIKSTSANALNSVIIRPNGSADNYNGMILWAPPVANYNNTIDGVIKPINGAIKFYIGRGAGTITIQVRVRAYR